MGTPLQRAITSVAEQNEVTALRAEIAELKAENAELKSHVHKLQKDNAFQARALEQFRNMHCNQIADMLVIRSTAITAINGKNVVERTNASRETEKLITDYVNNYGVEEYADVYHGKIHDKDIHSFPYKHSKLDVVGSCYKQKGYSKTMTVDFGQWVVDRPWS